MHQKISLQTANYMFCMLLMSTTNLSNLLYDIVYK